MKGAYTSELSPVAYYGQPVLLDDGETKSAFEVSRVAPLVGVETETVTVPENDEVVNEEATNLEMWDGWLAQYRPVNVHEDIPADVSIQVDQQANNQSLYQTKEGQGEIGENTAARKVQEDSTTDVRDLSNLLEYYVYEDEPPRFSYINSTTGDEDVTLEFAGFAFEIEPIRGDPDGQPVYVPVGGLRGGA